MTSLTGTQIIIYFPISEESNNQTMKLSHWIERNMRNIFLENSYTKWAGETGPRPFSNNSHLRISLNEQSEYL